MTNSTRVFYKKQTLEVVSRVRLHVREGQSLRKQLTTDKQTKTRASIVGYKTNPIKETLIRLRTYKTNTSLDKSCPSNVLIVAKCRESASV